jgi:DNA-binding winged helix-turn-helix (wHTH) protein/Tol biopolymer transport system component
MTIQRIADIWNRGFLPRADRVAHSENAVLAPIQLARESPFCLGDVSVYPATRQVVRNGLSETVEPRVMQVLVALFRANGRVVSRDDLTKSCWDGRIVSEHAINRVISRLRRLAEADRGASFAVQTIPKVGFRLVASDRSELSAPEGPERLAQAPASRWTVETSRPLISALALEGEPAFSPDGKMLAYTSGKDAQSRKIYVRNVARGDGIRVTSDSFDNVSPSWCSDGTRIAYVGRRQGEPCRIMVAGFPVGEAREVWQCAHAQTSAVSWQPGTSFVYFHDLVGEAGACIFRLDLDTGSCTQLAKTHVPEGSGALFQAIIHLQCSPDGKSLLYVWRQTASTNAIVIRDLASGADRTLGRIVGGLAAWSEDSRAVLAATASGIGSEITAYPTDGSAPYRVYAAADHIGHLSAAGGLLALESGSGRERLARACREQAVQPDFIDPANGRSWAPTFAPDGTLAFLSNRSSTNAVWVTKPGEAPALLYDAGLLPLFRLEYSRDGSLLAAAIAKPDGITIKILTSEGAVVTTFDSPTLGYAHPSWTPDGKEVIVFDRSVLHEVRIALDNPAQRIPVVAAPPWAGAAIRGNSTFCSRIDRPGLWLLDREPRLISAKYPIHFDPPITFWRDDVLVPDFDAADGPRILAQPLAGGPDRVLVYAPGAQAKEDGLMSKMAVNPLTGEIIYVAGVQAGTNIDLLTLTKR